MIGLSLSLRLSGGNRAAPVVPDTGAARLPGFTASGAGAVARSSSGAAAFSAFTASGVAATIPAVTSSGAAILTPFTAAGAAAIGESQSGSGAAILAAMTASGTATREVKAAGAGDVFEGGVFDPEVFGTGIDMPSLTGAGTGTATGLDNLLINDAGDQLLINDAGDLLLI